MKVRPIMFSGAMVRAVLDDRKTQTRRIAKLTAAGRVARAGKNWHVDDPDAVLACPYGQPGDQLWVREAFMREPHPSEFGYTRESLPLTWDAMCAVAGTYHYAADCGSFIRADGRRWTPSIHMPRAASRITLEVARVRLERLQAITEQDAIAEGSTSKPKIHGYGKAFDGWSMDWPEQEPEGGWGDVCLGSARSAFGNYINRLHGGPNWNLKPDNAWDQNPLVWVVEFRRASTSGAPR